jgi:ComF family protein
MLLSGIRSLFRNLLPGFCLICQCRVANGGRICSYCKLSLPWLNNPCRLCGIALDVSVVKATVCGSCLLEPPPFTFCKAVFEYETPIKELLTAFKFNAKFSAGELLAELLCEQLQGCYAAESLPQILVPVPLHGNRLRSRGFNQTALMARVLAHRTGIPVLARGLLKIRDTPPQQSLKATQRRQNLRSAFALSDSLNTTHLDHVLIIDDVVTTMSTVVSVTRVLRRAGIRRVDVWAIARAGKCA